MDNLKQKRIPRPDRVTLSREQLDKLDNWMAQVCAKRKGVVLNRTGMVQWVLDQRPDILKAREIKSLVERFYDEERYLKDTLKELKRRKENGMSSGLKDLLSDISAPKHCYRKPKSKKKDEKDESSSADHLKKSKDLAHENE